MTNVGVKQKPTYNNKIMNEFTCDQVAHCSCAAMMINQLIYCEERFLS